MEFKINANETTLFAELLSVNVDTIKVNEIFYNPGALFDISLLNSYFSMIFNQAIPFAKEWFRTEYAVPLPKTIMEMFSA